MQNCYSRSVTSDKVENSKASLYMMGAGFSLTVVKLLYFFLFLKPLGLCKYLACIYVLKIMEIREGGEGVGQ